MAADPRTIFWFPGTQTAAPGALAQVINDPTGVPGTPAGGTNLAVDIYGGITNPFPSGMGGMQYNGSLTTGPQVASMSLSSWSFDDLVAYMDAAAPGFTLDILWGLPARPSRWLETSPGAYESVPPGTSGSFAATGSSTRACDVRRMLLESYCDGSPWPVEFYGNTGGLDPYFGQDPINQVIDAANNLAAALAGTSVIPIIRLWHEQNGLWYQWSSQCGTSAGADTFSAVCDNVELLDPNVTPLDDDPANINLTPSMQSVTGSNDNCDAYICGFRRVAETIKSIVPNALIFWCPTVGSQTNSQILQDTYCAYPGDDVVDITGGDFYLGDWNNSSLVDCTTVLEKLQCMFNMAYCRGHQLGFGETGWRIHDNTNATAAQCANAEEAVRCYAGFALALAQWSATQPAGAPGTISHYGFFSKSNPDGDHFYNFIEPTANNGASAQVDALMQCVHDQFIKSWIDCDPAEITPYTLIIPDHDDQVVNTSPIVACP